jgi:hypothetical protein
MRGPTAREEMVVAVFPGVTLTERASRNTAHGKLPLSHPPE